MARPDMKFVLQKANPAENSDGSLTRYGMEIAEEYAKLWVKGRRDLDLERKFPELDMLFYDIRADPELARNHALPFTDARAKQKIRKSLTHVLPI